MKLDGKIALNTGAGGGIGRGIAEVFAAHGAHVAVNYLESPEQAQETANSVCPKERRAITVKADVSKRAEVEAMFEQTWNQLGPVEILVNNAGIETIIPLFRHRG